jgi:hypothetical protein
MDYPLSDADQPVPQQAVSPWIVLLSLVAFMLLGLMLGSLLIAGIMATQGLEGLSILSNLGEATRAEERNLARWANLFPHLFAFTGGTLITALLFFKRKWIEELQLQRWSNWAFWGAGFLFTLGIFPFAQTIYWINQQLPLPNWMREMEESANALVKILLQMDSPAELLLNLLTVGVVAAVGEELVFRGLVQNQLQKIFRQPVVAIWVTAIVFSAIHMQFVGFLPRMVLGAGLGYLAYWSRSLWLPIVVHFLFNSMQVIAYYFLGDKAGQFAPDQTIEAPNWLGGALGLVLLLSIGYYLNRLYHQQDQPK